MAIKVFGYLFLAAAAAAGQDSAPAIRHAIDLVEQGRCQEALPILEHSLPRLTDKQLRYNGVMAEARCAMALEKDSVAIAALQQLRHDFPDNPEVMYVTIHYFSQLAMRTSQELAAKAPSSPQARRLEAESFESQGKFDEAAGIYQGILKQNPNTPGIHYRLGQLLLAKAGDTGPTVEARAEFEKELQVDPRNASSEFVLGELDRRVGHWDDAAKHFQQAIGLDAGFAEAYAALGMSLTSAGKFAEAIAPLEAYVKMVPGDPTGHYQLAIAYRRTGNNQGAAREITLQQQTGKQ